MRPQITSRSTPTRFGSLCRDVTVLGTDGYGRSDTRDKLREFFEVSREYVVLAALKALADDGKIEHEVVAQARQALNIPMDKVDPLSV